MLRVRRDQYTYEFSSAVPPVATIDSGDRVIFETYDASTGRIRAVEDLQGYLKVRDMKKVNPAAGPLYVRDAEPGDEIVVSIERIDLADQGYIRAAPGAIVGGIDEQCVAIVPVVEGILHLPGGL